MSDYKVMRAFQRHDGKTLRTYKRGALIGPKDAAKIPQKTMQRLIGAGNIFLIPSPVVVDSGDTEVKGDGV